MVWYSVRARKNSLFYFTNLDGRAAHGVVQLFGQQRRGAFFVVRARFALPKVEQPSFFPARVFVGVQHDVTVAAVKLPVLRLGYLHLVDEANARQRSHQTKS